LRGSAPEFPPPPICPSLSFMFSRGILDFFCFQGILTQSVDRRSVGVSNDKPMIEIHDEMVITVSNSEVNSIPLLLDGQPEPAVPEDHSLLGIQMDIVQFLNDHFSPDEIQRFSLLPQRQGWRPFSTSLNKPGDRSRRTENQRFIASPASSAGRSKKSQLSESFVDPRLEIPLLR